MSSDAVAAAFSAPPSPSTRLALRWLGGFARRRLPSHPQLGIKLAQAREPVVPVAYLAHAYGLAAVAFLVGLVPAPIVLLLANQVTLGLVAPLVLLPFILAGMTFSFRMLQPELRIGARAQNLDANLPYALNFMAALASAGVIPVEVFGALGNQSVYGEVAKESNSIYRDTRLFSKDLVGALKDASRRTPSAKFEEFLQGSVSTITSGGDLKTYFLAKSEQFTQENRREQKAFLESMGVMAESYVVVAAAAPLFLIVILSVMMLLSSGGNPILFLNLLVLIALPVIHGAFTWLLNSMRASG